MEIKLNEREIEFLKQYAQVYDEEREKDGTRDPLVVVEDVEEIITEDGYEDEIRYCWDEETYKNIEELKEALVEEDGHTKEEIEEIIEELEEYGEALQGSIKKFSVIIKYKPIAYFLTRKEAEKYCNYQKHNLKKPRVYTRYMGYANNGDLQCIANLVLNIGKQLVEGERSE